MNIFYNLYDKNSSQNKTPIPKLKDRGKGVII